MPNDTRTSPSSTPLIPITDEQQVELARLKERTNSLIHDVMKIDAFDLSQVYPDTDNLQELYEQLTDLKRCFDSFRPFDPAQMANLREAWDTEYTYASNAIEGNTLTLQETSFVINEGMTIGGKPMKDHLEAINHAEAIGLMRDLATKNEPLNESELKQLHALILRGIDRDNAGVYRSVPVGIKGTDIVFPQPYLISRMMEEFFEFVGAEHERMHPVEYAAQLHLRLVNIHPFIDGNGRTCRLIMNLALLRAGYPVTIIQPDTASRQAYFQSLNDTRDADNDDAFERLIAKSVKTWIFKHLDMFAGNIGENAANKGYYYFKKIEPYLPT